MADKTASVMVVDDHPIIRQGLAMLINREADLQVTCEAGSMQEAIAVLRRQQPDIVIVDISMDALRASSSSVTSAASIRTCPCWSFPCTTRRCMPSAPCTPAHAAT